MPDNGNFIKVIQVGGGGGGPFTVATDTPVAGQTTVTDTGSGNAFVIPSPTAEITGQFAGTGTTFAGLPTVDALGDAVSNGDFAILTADDGLNVSGIYAYNGTAYVFAVEIADTFQTIVPAAQADVTSGTVVADNYVQADTLKVELDKKAFITPVADAAALTALEGTLVAGDEGKHLAYQADTDTLYIFDGAAFVETGSSDNLATADLTSTENRIHTFDDVLQIIGGGQKTILSSDSNDRSTRIDANNGQAIFQAQNNTGANLGTGFFQASALTASAFARIQADDPVTGITSKFEVIGDKLRIVTPAVDGGTAVVGQVLKLTEVGTGNAEYDYSGNDLVFADEATVLPAIPGEPTLAEISTFNAAERDRFIFYTGTNTATDDVLSVYYADKSGLVIQIEKAQEEGLRGAPVADNATLTALPARDYERRKVTADGKEYVFELSALTGTLADDATTGFWQEQISSGLVTTYIDSSAGATVQTLAPSTAAGVVRLFTAEDVTNTATLTVDTGETLNGVTDGTFLFSNYVAGTQFRADEVAGGWVVSVVGASGLIQRNEVVIPATEVTLVSVGTTLVYNDPTPAAGEVSVFDGYYYDEGTTRHVFIPVASDEDELTELEVSTNVIPVGASIEAMHFWTDEINGGSTNEDWNLGLVNGTTNQFFLNRVNTAGDRRYYTIYLRVKNAAEGQVVLAGMVTPEKLHYVAINDTNTSETAGSISVVPTVVGTGYNVIDLDDPQAVYVLDDEGLINTTENTIVIAQDGRYELSLEFGLNDSGSGNGAAIYVDGVAVSVDVPSISSFTTRQSSTIVDLFSGQKVEFGKMGSGTGNTFGLSLQVKQLPTSTVVMPGALEVEDVEILLDTGLLLSGETLTLPTDLSPYSYIRFETNGLANGGLVTALEAATPAASIDGTSLPLFDNGTLFANFSISGTTATLSHNFDVLANTFSAYGVKAQKSVINTTDTPVNDQATSGYMDIGTMRMQWGISNPTSASGLGTITLPAPFANSDYSLVGSSSLDTRTIRIYGHTTTSVNIHTRTFNGSGASDVLRWQAIGLKPA